MQQHIVRKRYHLTLKQFAEAILAFFCETIPTKWKTLLDKVSDYLRLATYPNFSVFLAE